MRQLFQDQVPTLAGFEVTQVVGDLLKPMVSRVFGFGHVQGGLEASIPEEDDQTHGQKQEEIKREKVGMIEHQQNHADRSANNHIGQID